MQFEKFYSLIDSVVGSFPHLHLLEETLGPIPMLASSVDSR